MTAELGKSADELLAEAQVKLQSVVNLLPSISDYAKTITSAMSDIQAARLKTNPPAIRPVEFELVGKKDDNGKI